MKWEDMIKIEPALKHLYAMAKQQPDSNGVRQLLDNYVGIYARHEQLRTQEAFTAALIKIFD